MRRGAPEADAICRGLERDFRDRFLSIGGGFSAWVSPTQIGVEALFGGRVGGPVWGSVFGGRAMGPVWGTSVHFACRRWPFGPLESVMTVEEAERRIREEIEDYLKSKAK
jgi:hypothetical protein